MALWFQMGTRGWDTWTFLPPNCPELKAGTLEEGCLAIIISVMLWMQKHYLPDRCASLYAEVAASYWEQEHGQEVTCIQSQSNHDLKRSRWLLATGTSVCACVRVYRGFVFKNKQTLRKKNPLVPWSVADFQNCSSTARGQTCQARHFSNSPPSLKVKRFWRQ